MRPFTLTLFCLVLAPALMAAPDEERLGRSLGYPVGTAQTWFFDESVRVGSFTHLAEIKGVSGGGVHELAASTNPMVLTKAPAEPLYKWKVPGGEKGLGVDDYLARQRIMGLLILKDGVIQVERYQYDRNAQHRFVSHSMAKSICSLAVGFALAEGKIRSLDERASAYAPRLAGTLLGDTSLRALLRMASGARYTEEYDGKDDSARFSAALTKDGIEAAARIVTEREAPEGERFAYGSAQTHMLGAALRGATGQSLSEYLTTRLWQALGAENTALWRTDKTGLELSAGYFNATLRDFGRLGTLLAYNGVRPDDPLKRQIIPLEYLLDATDWNRAPQAFRPGKATPYFGYGYQFWLYPGPVRRFALLGVYGQMICVDPKLRLVMVQTAANESAKAGKTSLAKEADALWRGVVGYYGAW